MKLGKLWDLILTFSSKKLHSGAAGGDGNGWECRLVLKGFSDCGSPAGDGGDDRSGSGGNGRHGDGRGSSDGGDDGGGSNDGGGGDDTDDGCCILSSYYNA